MSEHKTTQQLLDDLAYMTEMRGKTSSDTRRQMYDFTIHKINEELHRRQSAPVTPAPTLPPIQPIKHTAPPPTPEAPAKANQQPTTSNQQPTTSNQQPATNNQQPATNNQQPATKIIHAGNQHPVNAQQSMSATIQADHHTNPHNPTVTITWADGYTFTGDETAIRGRFTTTLRDTIGLRLVQKGRLAAMWRWSSPWRAAGFYQALTHLIGAPPTIQELGIQRPNDITRRVFQVITEKATVTAS